MHEQYIQQAKCIFHKYQIYILIEKVQIQTKKKNMNNWDNILYPMFKIIIPFQLLLLHHYCRLLTFADVQNYNSVSIIIITSLL